MICSLGCFLLGEGRGSFATNCIHLFLKGEKKVLNLGVDLDINYVDLSVVLIALLLQSPNL